MTQAKHRPLVLVQGGWLIEQLADWHDDFVLEPFDPSVRASGAVGVTANAEVLAWDGSDLPERALALLPRLKLVAGFGTGYGKLDLRHLRARGIALTNAAGANAHDVADHATALLLGLWHRLGEYDRAVREGAWRSTIPMRPSLRGRRAGIVGLGRIGQAIADRLVTHDLKVRWWGPRSKRNVPYERAEGLVALAEWADILIVASRGIEANRHQIDDEVLEALGREGVFINVSRGLLVDEDALVARLWTGRLGAAGLDVFEPEPAASDRWAGVPNTVLTPHAAGATREGLSALLGQLRENVRRFFAGEVLLSPVDDRV